MYRWLHLLGFRYKARKKYYFVKGHETPDTKQYRKSFVKTMINLKKRMYHWTQISEEDTKKYSEKNRLLLESGKFYTDKNNKKMVEYHVDPCSVFHDLLRAKNMVKI